MAIAGQVVLAIVIGLLIGSVLGLLIWKAWMVRHRKALRLAEQERSVAQYTHILDSLEVLCRAVEQKQVELSEAAIRISALLDSLPADISPESGCGGDPSICRDLPAVRSGRGPQGPDVPRSP